MQQNCKHTKTHVSELLARHAGLHTRPQTAEFPGSFGCRSLEVHANVRQVARTKRIILKGKRDYLTVALETKSANVCTLVWLAAGSNSTLLFIIVEMKRVKSRPLQTLNSWCDAADQLLVPTNHSFPFFVPRDFESISQLEEN